MKIIIKCSMLLSLALIIMHGLHAQNPIVRNQFSADPSARVFGNKVYVFPSHDIPVVKGHRERWFCMEAEPIIFGWQNALNSTWNPTCFDAF